MPTKNYSFPIDSSKMDAIEMYLPKGENPSFIHEELNRAIDKIYRRCVPKKVRDYIDLQAEKEQQSVSKKANVKQKNVQAAEPNTAGSVRHPTNNLYNGDPPY